MVRLGFSWRDLGFELILWWVETLGRLPDGGVFQKDVHYGGLRVRGRGGARLASAATGPAMPACCVHMGRVSAKACHSHSQVAK